jgi:hypothetical protein
MGAYIGALAVVAAARAEADLLERFRVADATAPDRAQGLVRLGLPSAQPLARYEREGIIRQAGTDRYYLDETALAMQRRRQGSRVWLVAIGGMLMLIGIGVAAWVLTSHAHRP